MKFIEFNSKKCDECYKCLRVCPTKAIVFTDSRRDIVDDLCIKCGLCQASCPQGALKIQNDQYKVKKHIKLGRRIMISLAPSYAAAFKIDDPKKLITALRFLGAERIEETAVAAEFVSQMYNNYIERNPNKNVLTTCCPSANYLVQYYYPELLDYMLPVVSPMIAHGKMLKEQYGQDAYVVFVGPCLAKKAEAEAFQGAVDAVLTFNELKEWLDEMNIDLEGLEPGTFDIEATIRGMAYPMGGSLFENDRKTPINEQYELVRIDGIDRCKDLLVALRDSEVSGYCVEMNICSGSCVNGPDMPHDGQTSFERHDRMNKYLSEHKDFTSLPEEIQLKGATTNLCRSFKAKPFSLKTPDQETIKQILFKIEKYSEKDYLNCGSCGYDTCIDKAIAVYNNLSNPQMCLPYLRKKAESLSSAIFEHTPNLVLIADHELILQEYNPTFEKLFGIDGISLKGMPLMAFIDEAPFKLCAETKSSIIGQRMPLPRSNQVFYCNAVYTDRFILGILTDITQYEKSREELAKVKEKTLSACQEVIDKQMRVAQEIASLLGETTAETKVNLNRLKEIVLHEEGY